MIKIELSDAAKEKNLQLHKKYIEETAAKKLEEYLKENQSNACKTNSQYSNFISGFFGQSKQERTNFILKLCSLDNLEKFIQKFENEFNDYFKFNYRESKDKKQKKIVQDIKEIFDKILNYKGFNTRKKLEKSNGEEIFWNRHLYVVSTGARVCPYCNRQYITPYISEDDSEKTTADVDHYFPQSLYPYLQMNIYNMIPSCNVCNSKTKGSTDKRHLNPYQDNTDSLHFEIPLDSIETLYSLDVEKIIVNDKGNQKARASKEVFKLEEIYQVHLSDVRSLLYKIKEYEAFDETYYKKTMGIDIGNIFWTWFDFLDRNPLEEPLVKLKQDIYEQLVDTTMRSD